MCITEGCPGAPRLGHEIAVDVKFIRMAQPRILTNTSRAVIDLCDSECLGRP